MKKFIFCFTIFFIAIIGVSAETFNADIKLPDHTIRVTDGVNTYDDYLSLIIRSNGDPVYCINPYEVLNTSVNYNAYNYNDRIFNLSDEVISKLNLIAYYGYGYTGHTDSKWYGVTQFLIWKELGFGDVYYTDKIGGNRTYKYQNEINELESLVNRYYLTPNFDGRYYEYDLNTQYSINDTTGLINNFEVDSDLDAYISNNRLYINTNDKEGVFELKFRKKSPITKDYLLYKLDGAQSLLYPGKVNELEFSVFIEVSNRIIEIHKQDSEGVDRGFASLEGAVYELYKNNTKIGKLTTDENGIAKRQHLSVGDYYIKEITPSNGYKLDTNTYHVYLNKDNKIAIINSYEEVIKGNLEIEKYYGENGVYQYEDGASFEIYDANNNYVDTINTIDGKVSKELDYGEYVIKQVKSNEGYKKVDDIKLNIEEEKKYKYILYNEKEPEIVKHEILKVNVPNTGIYSYNYVMPILFIIVGLILVIIGAKKVTLLK